MAIHGIQVPSEVVEAVPDHHRRLPALPQHLQPKMHQALLFPTVLKFELELDSLLSIGAQSIPILA